MINIEESTFRPAVVRGVVESLKNRHISLRSICIAANDVKYYQDFHVKLRSTKPIPASFLAPIFSYFPQFQLELEAAEQDFYGTENLQKEKELGLILAELKEIRKQLGIKDQTIAELVELLKNK